MRALMSGALVLIAAGALALAQPITASAAGASTSSAAETTASAAEAAQGRFTFRFSGVIIWSQPNPRSVRRGLGYPGQEFVVEDHLNGERYVCEGGESQDLWYYGRNAATGVRGWVNYCNISYEG